MPHVIPTKRDQLKVRISERAYRRIVAYAFRYANSSINSKIWREVYGVLIGALDKQNSGIVHVLDAIPMVVGERAGVNFEARQYVDMASIDASLYEKSTKRGRGLAQFLVGWWHTHPGFGFFFSQVDTMTHLGYQIANPNAMGLIFDHTQLGSFDCGLECLNLDDPTALMKAGHEFVIFELENYEITLNSIQDWAEKLQNKLKQVEKLLTYIDGYLRRKQFAQIQRNFGLLLVRKNLTIDEKQEVLGEDEETWVWDEKYLETMYRIPTFRKKLEHMLESAKNPKQKKAAAEKVRQLLQRPQTLLADILSAFWERLNVIANVYLYLDTRERQVIEGFDQRLQEYYTLLNTLLRKTGEILGDMGDKVVVHKRQQPAVEFIGTIPLVDRSPVDQLAQLNPVVTSKEFNTDTIPEKQIEALPQRIIVPIKTTPKVLNSSSGTDELAPPDVNENVPSKALESSAEAQYNSQKVEILKKTAEIIRREKKVSVSNAAKILNVSSKMIWDFLVDLDVDGSIECEFDGDVFTLLSDLNKFNALMEEKLQNWAPSKAGQEDSSK